MELEILVDYVVAFAYSNTNYFLWKYHISIVVFASLFLGYLLLNVILTIFHILEFLDFQ